MGSLSACRSTSSLEDQFLVAAAKRNLCCFTALYDRYLEPIYKYLLSRTGQKKIAEDLTADTFLSALEGLGRFDNSGNFSAWLFAIARNKLMDHYRGNGKTTFVSEICFQIQDPAPIPPETAAHHEDLERVSDVLATMEEDQIELLRLRFSAGLKFGEIASQLQKSESAVKKSYYRLLSQIKWRLEVAHVTQK